jgi:peroxiredoxin
MVMETVELGPSIHQKVQDFQLLNAKKEWVGLSDLVGANGLLIGFIGNIWHPTSIRRILWMQHYLHKFDALGMPAVLLLHEHISTIYGFEISSPLPVQFPMLADEDGLVHHNYRMDRHPGLLLIDRDYILHQKWLMPSERVWPKPKEIALAIYALTKR